MTAGGIKRVLFFAEDVTLAHIARPLALARALDASRFSVTLASGTRYERFIRAAGLEHRPITSVSGQAFLRALATGRPLYSVATLTDYVREDLQVIAETAPDVIVGDFRLSLSVSARRAGVPYVAVSNAYWSPFATPQFCIPSHPAARLFGVRAANAGFAMIRPLVFAHHSLPMHRLRRRFGLPSLGFDLRRVYTDGDYTLYADFPEMVPLPRLPQAMASRHRYLGAVLWSPPMGLPGWWGALRDDLPLVYVTMGSSGDAGLVPRIVAALSGLSCQVVVAGAGARLDAPHAANVYVADLLPGEEAARRARLVICNGGSPTCHQALAYGVPVLGIAGNLDQFLNMYYVVASGAGKLLRADSATQRDIEIAAREIMSEPSYSIEASRLSSALRRYETGNRLCEVLETAASEHYVTG